jgi:hypothetical protein
MLRLSPVALVCIQGGQQFGGADRLGQDAAHLQAARPGDAGRRLQHAAVNAADQRDAGGALFRCQMGQQSRPVHQRHLQIHHDMGRAPIPHMLQELVGVRHRHDLVAGIGRDAADKGADRRVVIDNQQAVTGHDRSSPMVRASAEGSESVSNLLAVRRSSGAQPRINSLAASGVPDRSGVNH